MTGTINPALFGMPDATTAGVPSGTTLTAYTGPMTITQAGTVIEGKIIDGTLTVDAANVTIKNCIIKNYGWWGIDGEGATNLTVQYWTSPRAPVRTPMPHSGSGTFIGNDISQSENGIVLQGGASVVRDNYIHDLFDNFGEPHIDGISVQGGQDNVLIEHNTIESWDTSAVFIKNDFGPINNITVRNNLMYGDADRGDPAATVYVYGPNTTNVSITNNYIETGNWYYVATSNASPTLSGNIQWDNKTDATPYPTSAHPAFHRPPAFRTSDRVVLERHRGGGRWHHQRQYPSAQGYRCRQQHRQDLRWLDPDRHNDRQFDRELGLHHLGPEQCEACADRDRDHLERPDQCRVRCGVRNGG